MRVSTILRFVFRLTLGLLAIIMGSAVLLWICYNELIHRFRQYTGTHWWEPFGIAPAMIAVGVYWLRTLRPASEDGTPKA